MRADPGGAITAYSRDLAAGETSEYVFTQFQTAEMTDAVFEAQVNALCEELKVLQSIVKARAFCPN
jgi:hypothetical protein